MPKNTQPEPDPNLAASPVGDDGGPDPEILDPKAVWVRKGNAREPGARVSKPGMAHLNAGCTKLLGDVAKARNLKTFTPQAVQVARGAADTYYLIPIETGADRVSEVKYNEKNSACRVDLYPYLQQSELIVPAGNHWFVPAKFDQTSKHAPAILLEFARRENLPLVKRGPRKPPQI